MSKKNFDCTSRHRLEAGKIYTLIQNKKIDQRYFNPKLAELINPVLAFLSLCFCYIRFCQLIFFQKFPNSFGGEN
jgi:hypothetical protein